MRKLIIIFAIIVNIFGISACKKSGACDVNKPLDDLPWLKEMVEGLEKKKKMKRPHHVKIYQCNYRDGIGFLEDPCIECPDMGYWLRNCEGEVLCIMWGLDGNPCAEYNIDFKKKKLIYKSKYIL